MSDALDSAPSAAPASDALPTGTDAVSAPNAITNHGGPENVDAPAEPAGKAAKPISIDDAIDRATAKVDGKAAAAGGDAKDPNKGAALERDERTGKFAPKPAAAEAKDAKDAATVKSAPAAAAPKAAEPAGGKDAAAQPAVDPNAPKHSAPARFSDDAKAVWETAPEPVKAEVSRMERELTAGLEKHKASAAKFDTIREFDEMATRSGTDLKTALSRYVSLEQTLRANPLKGLEAVCDNIGVSLADVARIVLGQAPDQVQSQADATIRELRQKIGQLEQQVGGVTRTFQDQAESSLHQHIETWASSRPHFEVYAPHIATEMRDGAANLDEAEQRVFAKYPAIATLARQAAPAAAAKSDPKTSDVQDPDHEAQTLKGRKSITGAPSPGSTPGAKKRSSSIDEAIDAAFAAAG